MFIPVGISYYSLSLIGYMADVYWKKERPEKNYFKLLLYTVYFPKLLEGPISRHRFLAEQLNSGQRFDYERFCFGLQRILWGYIKILIISGRANVFVSNVFGSYLMQNGSILLIATIFSAFDLYCDFSGCMDIALGASELFGIKIEENFSRPFFSSSVAEFWRRWHISLGTWFKDYVYFPLVISPKLVRISGFFRNKIGKRAGKIFLTIIPLMVVWILTGLWHGTGINYLIWGVYWGVLIILSEIMEPEFKRINKKMGVSSDRPWIPRFRMVRTFFMFMIGRLITLPDDLQATMRIMQRILFRFGTWRYFDGTIFSLGLDPPNFFVLIICLAVLLWIENRQEQGMMIRSRISAMPLPLRWSIYIIGILSVLILGVYGPGYNAGSFVYMNY